jgi:uncharacterized membrane protein YfcA
LQDLILLDFIVRIALIVLFAVGVGTLSSMLGIGGGVINTPLLIIVFGLTAQAAASSSLFAALFVASASSLAYFWQKPSPILTKLGLLLALAAIPGSLTGVFLRTLIVDDNLLRLLFGLLLFPIALRMIFSLGTKTGNTPQHTANERPAPRNPQIIYALIGTYGGGVLAGLLGVGGGVVVVPVLHLVIGAPIHMATATSMFIMIFTTSAGTTLNFVIGQIDLFFSLALGLGMVMGGLLGPKLALKLPATRLKHLFGIILLLPIIRMMRLGQLWLDPTGTNFLLTLLGDLIIWLLLVLAIGLINLLQRHRSPLAPTTLPLHHDNTKE